MLMTIDGSQNTYGDGSTEHPHNGGTVSRLYTAKEAISQILNSYGEVRWGMARFQQNSGHNYICMCSNEIPNNTAGCSGYGGLWHSMDDCRLCDLYQDYPDYDLPGTHDRVCINYGGGILDGCVDPISGNPMTGADILVPVGGNTTAQILSWIDHSESDPGEPGYSSSLAPENQPNPELRAVGGTPIGGSLADLYNQLSTTDIGNDPLRGCRPYSIIVLTDGAESCGTDPVSMSTQLLSVPDLQHSCSNDTQCPTNSTCNGSHCVYEVKTYVIAFAVAPYEFVNCNDIAVAGNTSGAIPANNTADLVAAMAGIIADSIRTELCNGIDDDCDGSTDEDFPELGTTCDNGLLGVCRGSGSYICAADGTGAVCDITSPGISPSAEVCDGLDNDCNGLVDDGITCTGPAPELCNGVDDDGDPGTPDGQDDPRVNQPCGSDIGPCVPGTTICTAGTIVCNTTQGPETEVCDNVDNDCNGLVDDGLTGTCDATNTYGSCSGVSYCVAGSWVCTARSPEEEICNNFDDNCDGNIDENLTRSCNISNAYGICFGTETCTAGSWVGCDATTPSLDICDGIDNDCDGDTDDSDNSVGQPCQGGCGVYICDNGTLTCTGETGTEETCNSIDDDCDGLVDEDLQQECAITNEFGTCTGFEICSNGMWGGCNAAEPAAEICNGFDDNCDGIVDNDAECPNENDVCYEGQCRPRCEMGEFNCDSTEECTVHPEDEEISICLPILQECGMTICNTSQVCVDEVCIDPCDPNPCGELEACKANYRWREGDPVEQQYICVNASCHTLGNRCDAGEFCHEGYCLEDPCAQVECQELESCERVSQDGSWVATCKGICECYTGQRCTPNGTCEPDPCAQVECQGYGIVCVEGQCVQDTCLDVRCDPGMICNEGTCQWNPCNGVSCPAYAQCVLSKNGDTLVGVCKIKEGNIVDETIEAEMTIGGGCSTGRGTGSSGPLTLLFSLLFLGFMGRRRLALTSRTPLLLLLLPLLLSLACEREVFQLKTGGDITTNNHNTTNANNTNTGNNTNANNTTNCTPEEEICDNRDNDCDGIVDNYWVPVEQGGEGHFMDDVANCGVCGNICAFYRGVAECVQGECTLSGCLPYFFDLDNDPETGCEYQCDTLGGEAEICDGHDNDCDGIADEYWIPVDEGGEGHFMDDPQNCGYCGVDCTGLYNHATGGCVNGLCAMQQCDSGWIDANGFMSDGCETQCVVSNGGVEICDGVDNDCNGLTDDATSGLPLERPCYNGPAGTEGVGSCTGGVQYCEGGSWNLVCVGEITPQTEQCDGADNDCDGTPDNGFDTNTDINNCGACGSSCLTSTPPFAYPTGCSGGSCLFTCEYGHHDLNNDLSQGIAGNGCEYACEPTATPGTEYCDGIDNDCDGQVDETGDLLPAVAGYCRTGGLCGTTVPTTCQNFNGTVQWVCNYPSGVETVTGSPNLVNGYETLCDGLDGDCDGTPDDDFYPAVGSACEDTVPGICRGTGTHVCRSDNAGTECQITSGGMGLATNETCNGLDDDCDGLVDEPSWNPGSNPSYVVDDTVEITSGGETVLVYQFEASRPTATNSDAGSGSNYRACSRGSVLPWSKVTHEQARLACQRAGMQLCSDSDWEEACNGSGTTYNYPYGNTFIASNCNGEDAGIGSPVATGSMPNCDSNGYGIEDLSGNLREWTTHLISYNDSGKAIYRLKGGSYRDTQTALQCSYDNVGLVEDAFSANVGFRCCTRCGNGTVDPGELCDDGNQTNGDGCNGVCAPDSCGNGIVEGSEECDCGLNASSLPGGCVAINGASESTCTVNCMIPEERCSSLYPGDQDGGGESSDCADPDCAGTWCSDVRDDDGDGFAEPDDCDDSNPNISPAAQEICGNGIDENCNGNADDIDSPDTDGDGDPRCVGGVISDCDDYDAERATTIPEICGDGIDNNCDGNVDTGCASACEIAAYERSYIGCEYYAVTTMNSLLSSVFDSNFAIVVNNANSVPAHVTVRKNGSLVQNATISAGDLQVFLVNYDATLKNAIDHIVEVTGGAYHIVSDLPVTVYQFNPFDYNYSGTNSYTNDASIVLPTHVYSRNYMVQTRPSWYSRPGFIAVIGKENGTTIDVTYNGHVRNGPNRGSTASYTLNAGEVIQIPSRTCGSGLCSSDFDFSGTTITVTNPTGHEVGVFAGHNCTDIPYGYHACDHIESQMFPVETWGKNFIATHSTVKTTNLYRILASEDNTTVTFTPSSIHAPLNLDAGEYGGVEISTDQDFTIQGDKPISVLQFLPGQQYPWDNGSGDPAMALLVPMEQYRSSYSFIVPSSMTYNYVNIIKPVGNGAATVYFDGVAIPESSFSTAIGSSYHGVYRRNISSSPYSHTITSSQPFGIMVYGFAPYTSYFYPGGLDLNIINAAD